MKNVTHISLVVTRHVRGSYSAEARSETFVGYSDLCYCESHEDVAELQAVAEAVKNLQRSATAQAEEFDFDWVASEMLDEWEDLFSGEER